MRTALEIYNERSPNLTRLPIPAEFPDRFEVEDNQTDWSVSVPAYINRPYCVTENLIEAMRTGVAESENISEIERSFEGFEIDEKGRPLNPQGRTGIGGRGHLYNWGEGITADAVVARHTSNGDELLIIRKPGETKPGLPGGFVNPGEDVIAAAIRETAEETTVNVDASVPKFIGRIITRSKRTTDNAWITTNGVFIYPDSFNPNQIPDGKDDVIEAEWFSLTRELLIPMSEHHKVLVQTIIDLGEISLTTSS